MGRPSLILFSTAGKDYLSHILCSWGKLAQGKVRGFPWTMVQVESSFLAHFCPTPSHAIRYWGLEVQAPCSVPKGQAWYLSLRSWRWDGYCPDTRSSMPDMKAGDWSLRHHVSKMKSTFIRFVHQVLRQDRKAARVSTGTLPHTGITTLAWQLSPS